jgi:hypothetical protein
VSGQPSARSNIITTASPIRTSAWPTRPSGPGTRASSCAPNASCTNSMSRSVSLVITHGVTVPYPAGAAWPMPSARVPRPVPSLPPVGGI